MRGSGMGGYFYLNQANEWPTFDPHGVVVNAEGALALAPAADGFTARGVFLGGPFGRDDELAPWYRLRASVAAVPAGTHFQLFTCVTAGGTPPFAPAAPAPFAGDGWRAGPTDESDLRILAGGARDLWVGGLLRGDGKATPVLRQLRVDYGWSGTIDDLPRIYRTEDAGAEALERFLALPRSVLEELEATVADLPRLFEPQSAPGAGFPSWLGWLAGWLDFPLQERWTAAEARSYLAQAFALHGRRGTRAGLRRSLKIYAGVEARVSEPAAGLGLWTLGERSTLGLTTQLAPAEPQGAVIGTTATLDRSHLTTGAEFAAPLFEDVAHRFCVEVYAAELTRPGALAEVREVIEREKPAHTTYDLCVIEPRMRLGMQARLGIDAIIAQGHPPAQVGMVLGAGVLRNAAASGSDPEEG